MFVAKSFRYNVASLRFDKMNGNESQKVLEFIAFEASKRGTTEPKFSLASLPNSGFCSIWELHVRNFPGKTILLQK